ncbi:MAG TPA: phage tail protein [Roseiflexaceae bacterium]|jgi:phage tail-like protein|nr:phage tail protein [Roseiflexaceae bacterium]
MAQSDSRNDPFPAFRFEVIMDNLPVAGFSECSGLQLEIEVQEYHEGGMNAVMRKFPGHTKQTNITLKRGIVDRSLWDWFYATTQGVVTFRNGTISVRDPSGGQEVMQWTFERAFPAKLTGPELNASQNNVAVETLELSHEGLRREK